MSGIGQVSEAVHSTKMIQDQSVHTEGLWYCYHPYKNMFNRQEYRWSATNTSLFVIKIEWFSQKCDAFLFYGL